MESGEEKMNQGLNLKQSKEVVELMKDYRDTMQAAMENLSSTVKDLMDDFYDHKLKAAERFIKIEAQQRYADESKEEKKWYAGFGLKLGEIAITVASLIIGLSLSGMIG